MERLPLLLFRFLMIVSSVSHSLVPTGFISKFFFTKATTNSKENCMNDPFWTERFVTEFD